MMKLRPIASLSMSRGEVNDAPFLYELHFDQRAVLRFAAASPGEALRARALVADCLDEHVYLTECRKE